MLIRVCLLIAIALGSWTESQAADSRSAVIQSEFERLYDFVRDLKPDGAIGGFMKHKKIGEHTILWELNYNVDGDGLGSDIIRLFNEHTDGTDSFAVSYYRTASIVPGRVVIRRFVGPSIVNWRNDTIDARTGEYLGTQGRQTPLMTADDRKMVQKWKIRLLK